MGKTSLDFLFTDKKAFKPTRDWAELIRSGKDKYANCRVVSFTRVKNLDSKWKHEYLQFIVEEETGKERARVYAERGNEKDLDWVTVGPAETTETGSRSDDDLPLPLASLIFGGKSGQDVTQRPTVLEIAEILAATTVIGGAYEFYGHSCFWYAYTAYDAIKRQFGKFATEKAWRWLDIGGAGNAGVKDAIGLGWPFLFKFYYVGDAKKFKEERETNMAFFGDERRQIVDANDIVNQVASNLNTDGYRSTYIDALRAQGIELSEVEINRLVQTSEQKAKDQADDNANWAKEFDNLSQTLIQRVSADPDANKYAKYYEDFTIPSEMIPQELSEMPTAEKMESALEETAQALKVVVGRILLEAQKEHGP